MGDHLTPRIQDAHFILKLESPSNYIVKESTRRLPSPFATGKQMSFAEIKAATPFI